ncbi:MAG: hypothetical protein GY866_07690 [Proteobacteria bacterium]|nr:hypothetical protein [Pseudomonadota bacterium]
MGSNNQITVSYDNQAPINGLGNMIGQYLEQNLRDSEKKVKQGLRLNICTTVEVDRGISISIRFARETILIKNSVGTKADLHLKSSYMLLGELLSGKVNPLVEVVKGNIKLAKIPFTKPFQTLRLLSFLKIPSELILDNSNVKSEV